jgi:hypothetical protein
MIDPLKYRDGQDALAAVVAILDALLPRLRPAADIEALKNVLAGRPSDPIMTRAADGC